MNYAPGVYDGVSSEDYHADPAIGSTSLKLIAQPGGPAKWKYLQANPEHKDAYDLGTIVHSITLEQDDSQVQVIDAPDWRTKDARAAKEEARAARKIPLLAKDWEKARAMRDAIMADPIGKAAFTGHRAEASVFHDDNGLMVKARPDAWHPGLLVDLKTCLSAEHGKFGRTVLDLGYYQSNALYVDVVKAATGEDCKFGFFNVEKEPPYLVSWVELDDEYIDYGRRMNERAKRIYRECLEADTWPGYPSLGPISLPGYAGQQLEELLENE